MKKQFDDLSAEEQALLVKKEYIETHIAFHKNGDKVLWFVENEERQKIASTILGLILWFRIFNETFDIVRFKRAHETLSLDFFTDRTNPLTRSIIDKLRSEPLEREEE